MQYLPSFAESLASFFQTFEFFFGQTATAVFTELVKNIVNVQLVIVIR
jgi:hypothetical protein